jgi:serine/threonine protein kinase
MGNICSSIKHFCEKLCNKNSKSSYKESLLNISENTDVKHQINSSKPSLNDFKIIKTLGKGSFGRVLLVSNIHDSKYYAMKVLKKSFVKKHNQVTNTKVERKILEVVCHPFIVRLFYAFQTSQKLYFVCEYIAGGEIFYHLRKEGCFSEERTKLYICELILALEYLHKKGIIYRDLKPENILLDKEGHLKLTDFGLSKIISEEDSNKRTFTICGTPEYLAPEVLSGSGYDKSVDWWSLGALMYEMLVGFSPFKENKRKLDLKVYAKPICQHQNISEKAYSLLQALLQVDPSKRIGSSIRDSEEIKNHPFFENINWASIFKKTIDPKFKPYLQDENDLSNFDRIFTEEDPFSQPKYSFFNFEENFSEYENFSYEIKNI